MSNLNLGQVAQKVQQVFDRPQASPQGQAPMPQGPQMGSQTAQRNAFPPAPQLRTQQKPTQIAMSDFKYNAFNIDKISLNITSKGGFNGVTPDMMIWNTYEYHVTDFKASADEVELSNYVNWALQDKGIQDTKIDFHDNQRVTLSGKYP